MAKDAKTFVCQARFRDVGVVAADQRAGLPRRSRAEVTALEDDDVAKTTFSDLERRGNAVDAASYDNDFGAARQFGPRLR